MKTYRFADIVYTIQGEGGRSGTPTLLLRFAGCNLKCSKATAGFDCDTDYKVKKALTLDNLLRALRNRPVPDCHDILLTGGEPAMQVDEELVKALRAENFRLAIETNGTLPLPRGIAWTCVSPKRGSVLRLTIAEEFKFVVARGDPLPDISRLAAAIYWLVPAADGLTIIPENVDYCIDLVKRNPQFRLGFQAHKVWHVA